MKTPNKKIYQLMVIDTPKSLNFNVYSRTKKKFKSCYTWPNFFFFTQWFLLQAILYLAGLEIVQWFVS